MNIILELPVNDSYSIVVASNHEINLNDVYGYSGDFFIALKHKNTYLKLSSVVTLWDLERILDHFNGIIKNEIFMSLKINSPKELGLSYNNYWNQVSSCPDQEFSEWIGDSVKLFDSNDEGLKSCVTFLYLSQKNNIELLITTKYPWFFSLKNVPMGYDEWLKHYKILHNFCLSNALIQIWIQKLQSVCTLLRKNVDEMYSS